MVICRMKNVTVGLQIQRRDTLDGLLPVLTRLGVNRMLLNSTLVHPTLGQRRLAEIGTKLRDAGIEVETYFTGHVLGEHSPDSLIRKIEAAKAVGISTVVVDRGGNKFTGRVAALVDALVENGVAISAKKEEK